VIRKGDVCMKKMLITGGTVFVSRYAAQYYADKYDVYVLNRNHYPQCKGVTLIESDRHCLGECLKNIHFDVVLDITAYDAEDVLDLVHGLDSFGEYILISSSAVYPETERQPFAETGNLGPNRFWRDYGTNKIDAEKVLHEYVPNAYILRPPYLYGPMNNIYREAFVFDCALQNRCFCLPGEGQMKLQFLYVGDLFRFIDIILEKSPHNRIFNVGNDQLISVKDWVRLCYKTAEKELSMCHVEKEINQRLYFPFYDYEYCLDIEQQKQWMPILTPMEEGLQEAFAWYQKNESSVIKKPLLAYIDENLKTHTNDERPAL